MKKIILIILLVLLTGCSSENVQAIKADSTGNQHPPVDINSSQDRTVASDLVFPISDDPVALSNAESLGFSYLDDALTSYYKAKGYHEDNLGTLINNGFLIFWPRNVSTGEPVSITGEQLLEPNSELFGTVSYRKLNNDTAKTTRVSYRPSESGDWHFISEVYPGKGEMERANITGCSVDLPSIENSDTRLLLAMFGQLTDFLFSGTGSFETRYKTLPTSFQDLLGPEMSIIRENFQSFMNLVQESDVVFKWGIDRNMMSNYIYLEIDGVIYIKHCIDFSEGNSMSAMKTMFSCEYDSLDTSSPILTENNLARTLITDEFFVSQNNIVSQ